MAPGRKAGMAAKMKQILLARSLEKVYQSELFKGSHMLQAYQKGTQ